MAAADKPNLGSLLKNRREEIGLSLQELAVRTRIRRTYLEALEENRFDILPGEAYLTGFLRVYARALGLRPSSLLALYEEQVADQKSEVAPPVSPGPPPLHRRQRNWVRPLPWLAVGLLVAAALFLISPQSNVTQKIKPVARGLVASAIRPADASSQEETAVSRPTPTTAPAIPGASATPNAPDPAVAETPAQEAPIEAPATPALARQQGPVAADASTDSPNPGGGEILALNFPGNSRLRLKALGPSTIEIAIDNRPPRLYDLAAAAALSWNVRQIARIRLTDPAAVQLWVNKQSLAFAGHHELVLQTMEMTGSTERP